MNDRNVSDNSGVRAWAWRWGPDEDRRPGLPWIGIFLVVFGLLLLVERMLPGQRLGDVAVLAAGLASLAAWILRRGTIALYAGAFLTALALPGTIQALGQPLGPGWGTLFFGLAFLLVAAVRASQGGGVGWQALYGGILVLIGGSEVVKPDVADVAWPLILVAVGLLLLVRGGRPG
ncbi:MAG TPA: hypothetical protein VHM48_10080 [Candidatus Limnocylindrales bacterium]|nr:hypothetical protein [Candidatus Limnocylindrales bacterium]